MSTFETLPLDKIKFDCRFYSGYKPCKKADTCEGCTAYSPRGTRILIIKLGAMGDVVRTTCLLPVLRAKYDPCHITWVTLPESRDLLSHTREIDKLLTLSFEDVLGLEVETFEQVYCFDKDAEAIALAARTRATQRFGFAAHPPTGALTIANAASLYSLRLGLSDELKFHKNTKSYPEIIYEMAELPYEGQGYCIGVEAGARKRADLRLASWIAERGGAKPSRIVGLNTGCGARFPTKQWSLEGCVGLARRVVTEDPAAWCVLLGGEREREFMAAIQAQVPDRRVVHGGFDNGLQDFMALLEKCDAVVSADSLAMHLAMALKRPTIALFGPTSHTEITVFGRGEKVVTDFSCAPCYLKKCPHEVTCMQAMTGDTVYAAVQRSLAAAAANLT